MSKHTVGPVQSPSTLATDRPAPPPSRPRRTGQGGGGFSAVSGPRTLSAMVLREMATSHGRSWGGYLWTIIDPIGGIFMMTLVFSMVLRSPPIGTNFVIFYATGYVPFSYFMTMTKRMSQAVDNSRALLSYPAVTITDALASRAIVTALTGVLVAYIIFSFVLVTQETRTDPQVFSIALSMFMASALGIGVGTMNCFLYAAFPPWNTIWHILTRPLFIVSCVFFIYDDIPRPLAEWLWYNPLVHVIGQMRVGFYHTYTGAYVSPVYVFAVSAVLTVVGLMLLVRYHREIINEW